MRGEVYSVDSKEVVVIGSRDCRCTSVPRIKIGVDLDAESKNQLEKKGTDGRLLRVHFFSVSAVAWRLSRPSRRFFGLSGSRLNVGRTCYNFLMNHRWARLNRGRYTRTSDASSDFDRLLQIDDDLAVASLLPFGSDLCIGRDFWRGNAG